ncbi:hypothetical protein ABIE09_002375 [Lysobacter enzymogenes]
MVGVWNCPQETTMTTDKKQPQDHGVIQRKPDGTLELVVRGKRLLRAP